MRHRQVSRHLHVFGQPILKKGVNGCKRFKLWCQRFSKYNLSSPYNMHHFIFTALHVPSNQSPANVCTMPSARVPVLAAAQGSTGGDAWPAQPNLNPVSTMAVLISAIIRVSVV
jgi:hypothetical protein